MYYRERRFLQSVTKNVVTSGCVLYYKVVLVTKCDKLLLQMRQVFQGPSDITSCDKILSQTVLIIDKVLCSLENVRTVF